MPSSSGASDPKIPLPLAHSEALIEPEKLLEAYFYSSTVGLCILDPDLRYLAVNETLARINGLAAPDHIGRTVREVLGEVAATVEPQLRQILSTGTDLYYEVSGKLPAREELGHWLAHYLPIKNETGEITRIGVILIEITAQKKLEESVQHLDQKLRQKTGRMQVLSEVTRLLSSNWDVPKVFPQISARIRRVLRQEFASFALRDPGSGLLIPQAIDFPLGKGLVSTVQVIGANTPAARSIEESTAKIFSSAELRGFDSDVARNLVGEGMHSLCCVPLMRPKGPLGVFILGSTRHDAFHTEDLELVNQVAAQLAAAIENHRTAAEVEQLKQRLGEERRYLEGESRPEKQFAEMIGDSAALRIVLDQVATVAGSEATVLILGETGTGKELVARAIHRLSRRNNGAFIKVNCAAIPTGLLESELFGHEKGAFTGAVTRKIGRMELADGGTLFLDEIGEIPLELQPKLLRVLQDHEFERLGSTHTVKANLRLIAATNRNLVQSVSQHEFRSDLFYRLNVFPIQLPALRDRREDIPLLVRHFVHKFARLMDRYIETIPKDTMKALMAWHWPGNIRELENLMERSVILSEGSSLRVPLSELHAQPAAEPSQDHTLDTAERTHIIRVLRETKGVLSGREGAARRLGLKRTTLQSKMQRLKITRADYSDPSHR